MKERNNNMICIENEGFLEDSEDDKDDLISEVLVVLEQHSIFEGLEIFSEECSEVIFDELEEKENLLNEKLWKNILLSVLMKHIFEPEKKLLILEK
jgi:hypothetical protein